MKKNRYFLKILIDFYFILVGFLFCQNIVVPLKIGTTPINLLLFLIPPLLLISFLKNKQKMLSCINKIPFSFYIFLFAIVLSFIPAAFVSPKIGGILPAFKGLLSYIVSCLCPIALIVVSNSNDRKYLFFGLLFGFLTNVIVSIIAWLGFNVFGYTLSLSSLFTNDSFFVPNYFSSAQGLFLEPSHYAGFIIVVLYLLLWYFKSKIIRIVLICLAWLTMIMYGMGNLPLFVLSQITLLIWLFGKPFIIFLRTKVLINKKRSLLFVFLLLTIVGCSIFLFLFPLNEPIKRVFEESDIFGSANEERFLSAKVGLNIFIKYPFGVGFNLSGMAIATYYSDILNTYTSHSYFIQLLSELGLLGLLSFLVFCLIVFVKTAKKEEGLFLSIALLFGIMFSFLNGRNEPFLYVLFGTMFYETTDSSVTSVFQRVYSYFKNKYLLIKI